MQINFSVAKKYKYLIHSILISILIFLFSYDRGERRMLFSVLIFALVIGGSLITQYPNIKFKNFLMTLLLPLHLVGGTLLSLIFFPNLSVFFKFGAIVTFCVAFYITSLINNVFLVVEDRNEFIPLYRVAVTWSQIIVIIIAIPYFAGVFKLNENTFIQNLITGVSSFLFSIYVIWSLRFDSDAKKPKIGEKLILSAFVSFCVFLLGVSFSFVPTESFLRALFVSSVLMFGLGYLQNHLKNSITKGIVTEYILICFFFLAILLIFVP